MQILFWIAAFLVFYVYIGYPIIAWCLARVVGRGVAKSRIKPTVCVVTAAFNEQDDIGATIRNKLEQDYPKELLDIIVVSDESTDNTDDIVDSFGERVRLIRQVPRSGKTAALSLAVEASDAEILVFSDANSLYSQDAISELVSNFADPAVGYVTGMMIYVDENDSIVGDGCSAYMKYENWLRGEESRLAAVIGVDGGVDAVRRRLFHHMRPDQLPDFVLPLHVAGSGHRVVFEPKALLRERTLSEHQGEYRMRVRVTLRALCALWDMKRLMNPLVYPMLAFQLISHKLLRYVAFISLFVLLVTNAVLATTAPFFLATLICQIIFYCLAVWGWKFGGERYSSIISIPYYFLLLNVTAAHAFLKFIRGEKQATWSPRTG